MTEGLVNGYSELTGFIRDVVNSQDSEYRVSKMTTAAAGSCTPSTPAFSSSERVDFSADESWSSPSSSSDESLSAYLLHPTPPLSTSTSLYSSPLRSGLPPLSSPNPESAKRRMYAARMQRCLAYYKDKNSQSTTALSSVRSTSCMTRAFTLPSKEVDDFCRRQAKTENVSALPHGDHAGQWLLDTFRNAINWMVEISKRGTECCCAACWEGIKTHAQNQNQTDNKKERREAL